MRLFSVVLALAVTASTQAMALSVLVGIHRLEDFGMSGTESQRRRRWRCFGLALRLPIDSLAVRAKWRAIDSILGLLEKPKA